ncbi:arginase [Leifsonia sp. Root112D2]|nr:arginase [Leifsonia sp. Root112D2]
MRLIDGAEAIRGDLPRSATQLVDVPLGAGESLDTGIRRFSSIVAIRELAAARLHETSGDVVTIGGDCGADLASVAHAVAAREPGSVALLWFDAHGDLNDAASSTSGAFGGMALRALLGDAPDGLAATPRERLAAEAVILAGTRSLDDAESAFIDERGIRMVSVDELAEPDALLAAVASTGATSVYIHVDLDVLDPATISGVGYPEPFGLQPELLCELLRSLRSRFELAGACVAGFAPESPDAAARDLPVILRVLGALTAPLG